MERGNEYDDYDDYEYSTTPLSTTSPGRVRIDPSPASGGEAAGRDPGGARDQGHRVTPVPADIPADDEGDGLDEVILDGGRAGPGWPADVHEPAPSGHWEEQERRDSARDDSGAATRDSGPRRTRRPARKKTSGAAEEHIRVLNNDEDGVVFFPPGTAVSGTVIPRDAAASRPDAAAPEAAGEADALPEVDGRSERVDGELELTPDETRADGPPRPPEDR